LTRIAVAAIGSEDQFVDPGIIAWCHRRSLPL
jgi:hypothetical protein